MPWRAGLRPLALFFLLQSPLGFATEEDALAADDECSAADEGCGLNALQRQQRRLTGSTVSRPEKGPDDGFFHAEEYEEGWGTVAEDDFDEDWQIEDDDEGLSEGEPESTSSDEEELQKADADEVKAAGFQQCGGKGYTGPTTCRSGYTCVAANKWYSMCRPAKESKKDWKVYNGSAELDNASEAPLLTFYMYRAQGPGNFPLRNVNTASLAGVLWYVHNEVASCDYGDCDTVRRFGINRIVRYKAQTRATTPLARAGMNFGVRYAFDTGACTGPWVCETQFQKYGYFVGCNNLSSGFPFPNWPTYYGNSAVWYSLPGNCPVKKWRGKSFTCKVDQPGGACDGEPTGSGTCTYSVHPAGEIYLDELENITDYHAFRVEGGQEYNKTLDAGVNMTFWDEMNNTKRNLWRVQQADALFKRKYSYLPSDEDLATPACDFDKAMFYDAGLPTELNRWSKKKTEAED